MEPIKNIVKDFHDDIVTFLSKMVIGFGGSITAASLNTWIGIIAGILTCVYMFFQIEGAWHKRKNRGKK